MNAKLPSAERRTKAEPAAPARVTFGPMDHGRRVTADELESADYFGGFDYEVIHGRLYVSPLPNMPHDELAEWVADALRNYARARPDIIDSVRGRARVFVPGQKLETCPEPDVAAYHNFPFHVPWFERRWQDVSPTLVAEIVSTGDIAKDLVRNVDLYARVPSIQEYWVVNQWWHGGATLFRVFRRRGKGWRKPLDFQHGDTYTTKLLPGFRLVLDPDRR